MNFVESVLREENLPRYGFVTLERPLTFEYYKNWVESGQAGSMEYLKTHMPSKETPQKLMARAKTAIVVAVDYVPHPKPHNTKKLNIALYAQGEDYHHWMKSRLNRLCEKLKSQYPDEEFQAMVDSSPVMERDLAYRAGLGWVGKNTCVISQTHGSLFFIGEIYTSLGLTPSLEVAADRCGTCTRCIDACPTQALYGPRQLDARKCISYLTIESKQNPPLELRSAMGDLYFGCDICQTVCPWNQKVFGETLNTRAVPGAVTQGNLIDDLRWILTTSGSQIEKAFLGTPLTRASSYAHRRNAIVVAANMGYQELLPEIKKLGEDARLAELVKWATEKLDL